MKSNINKISYLFLFIFTGFIIACSEDYNAGELITPSNLSFQVNPIDDGSGNVEVSYASDNSINHVVKIWNITNPDEPNLILNTASTVNPNTFTSRMVGSGDSNFRATYYAYGTGSLVDSLTTEFSLFIPFELSDDIKNRLTGGSTKIWYWDAANSGHLGVGPDTGSGPDWYAASAFEKPDCLYDDELIFTLTPNGNITYQLNNQGQTFIHVDHQQDLVGTSAGTDECYDYNTSGTFNLSFAYATSGIENSTGVQMGTGNSFLSYALGTNSYEILTLTDSELYVRTIETAPDGSLRAWYLRFVSQSGETNCADGFTGNQAGTGNYELIWEDDFNTDGSPCEANWAYDIGTGGSGWGNNESQYYTNLPTNIIQENGSLKITARREFYEGSEFTSARIKTQDKFEFTYGKVEVRAKLPVNPGTWPAIWMLGANFNEVGWPTCGEIDIMEHIGNNPNVVMHTLHTAASSGNSENHASNNVNDVTQFHLYSIEWSPTDIKFFIDDVLTYTFAPAEQTPSNWPFSADQFLILNMAMGGNLGGNIPAEFSQATFEIDYVKVYQK